MRISDILCSIRDTRSAIHGLSRALILGVSLPLAGCHGVGFPFHDETFGAHGPMPLIEPDEFEMIDLALLLDPTARPLSDKYPVSLSDRKKRLQEAFVAFRASSGDKAQARNRLQEQIIAASNQRCGRYKQFLNQFDTESNLLLGSLTTLFAGAGALFTVESTARTFSGAAAITSGIQAEVTTRYFSRKTVQVLTNAMEARRRERYETIAGEPGDAQKRGKQSWAIAQYPVEAAIKDAISYHDDCSLIAALEYVALSIERAENPGVKQLKRTLKELEGIKQGIDAAAGTETMPENAPTELLAAPTVSVVSFHEAVLAKDELSGAADELHLQRTNLLPKKADVKGSVKPGSGESAEDAKAAQNKLQSAIDEIAQSIQGVIGNDGRQGSVGTLIKEAKVHMNDFKDEAALEADKALITELHQFMKAKDGSLAQDAATTELAMARATVIQRELLYRKFTARFEESSERVSALGTQIREMKKKVDEHNERRP